MTLQQGELRWIPGLEQVGVHFVTLSGANSTAQQRFSIRVEPALVIGASNRAPEITSQLPSTALTVGDTFSYSVVATDPDGDPVALSLRDPPGGMVLSGSTISWVPTSSQVGEQRVLVLASDGRGGLDGQGIIFNVGPQQGNAPPVITSTPVTEATSGAVYTYDVEADDPDDVEVVYTLVEAPEGMEIDEQSGVITWTPKPQQLGAGANVFLIGHDPDNHARFNLGARRLLYRSIAFGRASAPNPSLPFLFVESRIEAPFGFVAGRQGLLAAGFVEGTDFVHVDAAQLAGVPFSVSRFSALVVASDFGGLLTQAELDLLNARKSEIAAFINDGGGVVAFAESGTGESPELTSLTPNGGYYEFLPIEVDSFSRPSSPYRSTPFGRREFGLGDDDFASPSHAFFLPTPPLEPVSVDANGRIMSLAGTIGIEEGRFVDPEPTVIVAARDAAGNTTTQEFEIGLVRNTPVVACPEALDFGQVEVGTTAKRRVMLMGGGGTTLLDRVEVVGSGAGPYFVSLGSSNGQPTLDVEFRPTSVGAVSSQARIVSVPGVADAFVALQGQGTSEPQGPRFLSLPPTLALAGRRLAYPPEVEDPAGGGLAFGLLDAPTGLGVNSVTGLVTWAPGEEQAGTHEFELVATDVEGRRVSQAIKLQVVRLSVSASAKPTSAPPGENAFLVTISVEVEPTTLVRSDEAVLSLQAVAPLSTQLTISGVQPEASSEGLLLNWRLPLRDSQTEFTVQGSALEVGSYELIRSVRLGLGRGSQGLGEVSLIRSFPSGFNLGSSSGSGLGYEPSTNRLWATSNFNGTNARLLDAEDGSFVREEPLGAGAADIAPLGSELIWLAAEVNRRTPAGLARTKTIGIGPSLQGADVDPRTGELYFVSNLDSRLYRVAPEFGQHVPLSGSSVTGLAWDPEREVVWEIDASSNGVRPVDLQGNPLPGEFSFSNSDTATFDPTRAELLLISGGRITRIERDLANISTSPLVSYNSGFTRGMAYDPVRSELYLADFTANRIVRLGPEFGDTRPLVDSYVTGSAFDPSRGERWELHNASPDLAYRIGPNGEQLGVISLPGGVAAGTFDARRDELLTAHSNGRIYRYAPGGENRGSISVAHYGQPLGIAAHPDGSLWLADRSGQRLVRLPQEFGDSVPASGSEVAGLAIDPASGERWYAFDWGSVHFVAMDTEALNEDQLAWLERDLEAHQDAPWIVVYGHHPPYSSGHHGSSSRMRELTETFERHGVDLVFTGHDHHYERTLPMQGGCVAQPDDTGITYIIAGAGGAGLRGDVTPQFWHAASDDTVHSYVRLTIHGCVARGEAVSAEGEVLDSFELGGC
ncbi:MAG TPA: hypothetical protein DEA08_08595 [Planctomycetes bacterium]|nr:hypothetical protein [Planctomycetota bacterium]